jgi:Uma2 family endonuclease
MEPREEMPVSAEAVPTLPPPQGWTVDDIDRLPESDIRYELVDGVPWVTPPPAHEHQTAARRLANLLEYVSPGDDFHIVEAVGVIIAQDQRPIPDVLVLRHVTPGTNNFPAEYVALVAEVVSPSTRSHDRFRKPALYAQAGIPSYLRVELDPLHVVAYRLDPEGVYTEYARAAAGETVHLDLPFPISFDPAALLRLRP